MGDVATFSDTRLDAGSGVAKGPLCQNRHQIDRPCRRRDLLGFSFCKAKLAYLSTNLRFVLTNKPDWPKANLAQISAANLRFAGDLGPSLLMLAHFSHLVFWDPFLSPF